MATTRRRSQLLADNDNDVSPAGQAAEREQEPEKMVTVSIARDFTLTGDDHKPIEYKAGIDEMPLSHANHWFAKNAGGVTLYVPRRSRGTAQVEDQEPTMPPKGDPTKIPDFAVQLGIDNTKTI